MKLKKLAIFALFSLSATSAFADVVSATSMIRNQAVYAGRYSFVKSTHQSFASNPTSATIRYRIEYRTCGMIECYTETLYKDIAPGQSWSDNRENKVWSYFQTKGNYRISAETYIYGPYSSRVINYATMNVT
jgi:hypothetical protein